MAERDTKEAPVPQVVEELCSALPRPEGVLMWVAHTTDNNLARQEFMLSAADAVKLGTRLIDAASRQMQCIILGKTI